MDEKYINYPEESAPIDAEFDTTDVQGNNIKERFLTEATKTVLSLWIYQIRKTFANSKPHKK